DLGAEIDFGTVKLKIYRQNFYDVGALSRLANIRDGLNGVTVKNKEFNRSDKLFQWGTILFEFFYSKHQAGEFGSKVTKSGDEDYYNNYFYREGWSYKNLGLGNPLISKKSDVRTHHPVYPSNYFSNNRVIAFHFGNSGKIHNWDYNLKATYSLNYGTFGTSPEGHSLGELEPYEPKHGLFGRVNQFSGYLEANK